MKKHLLSLALTLSGGFLFAASGATLIQFNLDNPHYEDDTTYYEDISGNGRGVKFNRRTSTSSDNPFTATHPELADHNLSAGTRYSGATTGSIENVSDINLSLTKTFTMEGWIYVEEFRENSKPYLWRLTSSAGGNSNFGLRYGDDGTILGIFTNQGQAHTITTDAKLELKTWAHLAYVKTTTSVIIYLNGVQIGSLSESRGLPKSLDAAYIGVDVFGQFDDLRFSDEALTPDQFGLHAPFTTIPEPGIALLLIPTLGACYLVKRRTA